jgi:hypothetical protein
MRKSVGRARVGLPDPTQFPTAGDRLSAGEARVEGDTTQAAAAEAAP